MGEVRSEKGVGRLHGGVALGVHFDYNAWMQTQKNTALRCRLAAVAAIVVVAGTIVFSQATLTGQLTDPGRAYTDTERSERQLQVLRSARAEIASIEALFSIEETDSGMHAAAPEPQSLVLYILDEIARWFGLEK